MVNRAAQAIIDRLGLEPHPERGYYRQTYRAEAVVTAVTHDGPRAASTAIYFLVTDDAPETYLHRLRSDEVFHLYDGGPHCLVGCTVAPGFEFADFELAEGPELADRYPHAADRIARMSRRGRS